MPQRRQVFAALSLDGRLCCPLPRRPAAVDPLYPVHVQRSQACAEQGRQASAPGDGGSLPT
eukprot:3937363-Rhodomonas_salina.1